MKTRIFVGNFWIKERVTRYRENQIVREKINKRGPWKIRASWT